MKSSIASAFPSSVATAIGRFVSFCTRLVSFRASPFSFCGPPIGHSTPPRAASELPLVLRQHSVRVQAAALMLLASAWLWPTAGLAQTASDSPITQTPERSDALASSTALAQARRLREEGDAAGALKTIEMALQRLPRDVALRFTRAVMQADLGQTEAAVAGFTALTQEYPELPEPYNNLATLHAARGDLDRARAALDEAVRAMPVYALAWENLGDVHLRLAERAWQQASQLDKASEASTKLKLARDLITRISPPATQAPSATRRP